VSRYFFMSRTALRCRVRELCAYFPYPGMVRGQGWMLATRSRDDGIADTDVDRAMQPQQGNPVVTRAEGLLRFSTPRIAPSASIAGFHSDTQFRCGPTAKDSCSSTGPSPGTPRPCGSWAAISSFQAALSVEEVV
jgi:hypothetical protein